MIVLYSNQNNAQAKDTEICPTLPASMGMGGGGYVPMIVTYQNTTGTLSPGQHAGSYNGQDAYNDMLIRQDELFDASNRKIQTVGPGICSEGERPQGCHGSDSQNRGGGYKLKTIVRRLTPLECERLQGFPSKKVWDISKMTKDEYIAWNLAEGNIIADTDKGKVYATRGAGGCPYKEPKELSGTELNGYKVVSIRNGATKLQCRVHRIIWIAAHGIIPVGYVIDHINNDKKDNRLSNLQLLTPTENSHKAKEDGLYKCGLDNKATKVDPDLKDEIAFLYEFSEMSYRDLAEVYGISKSRIVQIVTEVGWTDIGEWTDTKGKKRKEADSPRYKALGNSIATPFWFYLLRRISAQYERPATLGSLFDGISGFPYCWERCNGHGTALWSSEIEPFCIAVAKKHFGEE